MIAKTIIFCGKLENELRCTLTFSAFAVEYNSLRGEKKYFPQEIKKGWRTWAQK